MTIKEIKKELSITNKDIAEFFGYKTEASYYYASRRRDIENGIVNLYRLIKSKAGGQEKIKEDGLED